jgi:hypothetical protein
MRSIAVKHVVWIVALCAAASASHGARAAKGYNYFVVGNPGDVVTTTGGLLVLQGGGTDIDENFVRTGAKAGGGDFVVIRASGTDAYNPYVTFARSRDSAA